MNNDDNNIELPKRVDEVPKEVVPNDEPALPTQGEAINFDNLNQNPIIDENVQIDNLPQNQPEIVSNNIFEGEVNNLPFEPIPNLDVFPEETTITSLENNIENTVTPEVLEFIEESTLASNVNLETPIINPLPENEEPLNKKVVVEDPITKEKGKGNPVLSFFVLLIILAIILAAFYYFIKIDFIKIPDEIRNKIPFLSNTTTITTTTAPIIEEEDNADITGDYLEDNPIVCPEKRTELLLKADKTFIYKKLTYNEETEECSTTEISGNYTNEKGSFKLTPSNETDEITGTYTKTPVTFEIKIPVENDKVIILYGRG